MGLGIELFFSIFVFCGVCLIFLLILQILLSIARFEFEKPRPKEKVDNFKAEYGYSWLFVFVFEVLDDEGKNNLTNYQREFTFQRVIDALNKSGS